MTIIAAFQNAETTYLAWGDYAFSLNVCEIVATARKSRLKTLPNRYPSCLKFMPECVMIWTPRKRSWESVRERFNIVSALPPDPPERDPVDLEMERLRALDET